MFNETLALYRIPLICYWAAKKMNIGPIIKNQKRCLSNCRNERIYAHMEALLVL
jgi:hypothetical protein